MKVLVPEPRLMATLASFAISAWYLQIALYLPRTSSVVLGGLLCVCMHVCVCVCVCVSACVCTCREHVERVEEMGRRWG